GHGNALSVNGYPILLQLDAMKAAIEQPRSPPHPTALPEMRNLMRHSLHRTAAACVGRALAASVVLTGCSDDESTEATETTTTAAAATSTEAAAADPATIEAIEATYATFFDSTKTPEERAAKVQQSDAF